MPKKDYVTVCPRCGSTDVSFEKEAAYVATGLSNQYRQCNKCGFHGIFFPEVLRSEVMGQSQNVAEIKKEKVELVQTSFGKGYFKYLMYIAIPIFLIIIILFLIFK